MQPLRLGGKMANRNVDPLTQLGNLAKLAGLAIFSVGIATGWTVAAVWKHLLWEPERARR